MCILPCKYLDQAMNFLNDIDKWIQDLIKVGYRDIQTILDDEGTFTSEEKSPCIGRDALRGVYFHPAPAIGKKVTTRGTCI